MEWHPKPISWASENKLLEPSSLDRILRQLLVPTLFAGAGGQRRHPSRGWQVQLELQVSGVTSPSYPGHSLQFWSKNTAIPFWHFSTAQSHLTVTLMTVSCCCQVPMTETTWMPALQLCADTVLTDLMTASNESLTSVKQAAYYLFTREVTSMQIQVSRSEKSWRFFGRNQVDRMATAVDGVAYGWELTGSVEG